MTRKGLGLLLLVGVILVSTTFTGCTKPSKGEQITALQVENANLKGKLSNQENLQDDIRDLEDELVMARQDTADARAEAARAREAAPTTVSGVNAVMKVNVSGSVAFAAGSDVLTSAGKKSLDGIASKLQGQYSGQRMSIDGHTDSSPLVRTKEKWHTNLWLSANRARAVADYLMSRGVTENRISIAGHGAGAGKGRLVEVIVLSN